MRTTPGHINGCLTLPVTCSLLQTDSRPSGSRTEEQPRSQLHYRTMILFRQNVAVTVAAALQSQHRVKSALSLRSTCNRDIMMHSRVKVPAGTIGARCTGSGSHWALRHFLVRSGAVGSASVLQAQTPTRRKLLYDGIIFDMDGTLTEAHIDFADMRARTGIPVGDLFVAMESWEEPERIKRSMDIILEIEAEAAKTVSAKEGLVELLQLLKESEVKVALVTRNTTNSVNAFFKLIGEEWGSLFSEIRTREFRYVKPDKRLLMDVAKAWQLHPGRLLMVGDSFEDVEVGNAAGTASCLIAGGGNEPGSSPPAGAIPTFSVNSLTELRDFLLKTAPSGDTDRLSADSSTSSSLGYLGWSMRTVSDSESDSEDAGPLQLDPTGPGNPAAGIDFMDFLIEQGAIRTASCSFPRMGAAAGGLQACAEGGGDTVLHLGCGDGALSKILASKGLAVIAADKDVTAATRRGLKCVQLQGTSLSEGLFAGLRDAGRSVDAVLVYAGSAAASGVSYSSQECSSAAALQEYKQVLKPGGHICIEVPLSPSDTAADIQAAVEAAGFVADVLQLQPAVNGSQRVRIVGHVLAR